MTRLLACLALPLLLAGCTALKLGYENLPRLVEWQVDRFLALDADQEALVMRHAKALQRWHRQALLPVYADFLRGVEQEIHAPVSATQVAQWRQTAVSSWAPLAERLAPAVAEVALTLRPEQLAHLDKALAKSNDKAAAEYRPADPAKRQVARYKRLVERTETFLGDTNDAQRKLMRESAAAMSKSEDDWWQARLARQKAIVELLTQLSTEKPPLADATRRARLVLAGLFDDMDARADGAGERTPQAASPERQVLRTRVLAASATGDDLTARLLALATPEQRQHLVRRLDGYRQDFHLLAAR
jgi:hypothetical protein